MKLKNRLLCAFGSVIEWYDFALYGYFAAVLSKVFFVSSTNSFTSLLAAYGVFAIGFIARPFGAIIFGYIGDKYGRTTALKITMPLMTIISLLMALLPSYHVLGNLALILLISLRIVQGVVMGGEYSGNMVYLCEFQTKWRYFWGSIASCTGSIGIILASLSASLIFSLFSHEFVVDYGWRIAFLLAVPFGIMASIVRFKLDESPLTTSNEKTQITNPVREVFKYNKLILIKSIGLIALHATSFYFTFMFLPVYLDKFRNLPDTASLVNNTIFLIIHLLLIPIFGYIVNIKGGNKMMLINNCIFILFSIPIFYAIAYGSNLHIIVAISILSVLTSMNAAIIPGLVVGAIDPRIRFTVTSLAFNIGFGVIGGIVPMLCLFLVKNVSVMSPAYYLVVIAIITTLCIFVKPNSKFNGTS